MSNEDRDKYDRNKYDYVFKIIIVGLNTVGKTSLICRYTNKGYISANWVQRPLYPELMYGGREFAENRDELPPYQATVGVDFHIKMVHLQNAASIKVQLWDTGGHVSFRGVIEEFCRKACGLVVVYDITNRKSFNIIPDYISTFREKNLCEGECSHPILIVGNKSDLHKRREISTWEGSNFAQKKGYLFVELNCFHYEEIEMAFYNYIQHIYENTMLYSCQGIQQGIKIDKKNKFRDKSSKFCSIM